MLPAEYGPNQIGSTDVFSKVVIVAYALFVYLIATGLFSPLGLHPKLWLMAYAIFILLVVSNFVEFLGEVIDNLVYVLFGLLCLVSALWSAAPEDTVRFGIQTTFSILIALFIGMRLKPTELFYVFLIVSVLGVAMSWINQGGLLFSPVNDNGLFRGAFGGKNSYGEAAMALAIACPMALFLLSSRHVFIKLALIIVLVGGFQLLMKSQSASGLLLSIGGVILVVSTQIFFRSKLARALMALFCSIVVSLALITAIVFGIDLWGALLDSVNKESTLTGRTVLWGHAMVLIQEHPILGIGANGFWNGAEYRNEVSALQNIYGDQVLSFHNLAFELAVSLGVLGPIVHALMGLKTFKLGLLYAFRNGEPMGIWVCVLVLCLYVQALFGTTLYKPHEVSLILLVSFGVSLGRAVYRVGPTV